MQGELQYSWLATLKPGIDAGRAARQRSVGPGLSTRLAAEPGRGIAGGLPPRAARRHLSPGPGVGKPPLKPQRVGLAHTSEARAGARCFHGARAASQASAGRPAIPKPSMSAGQLRIGGHVVQIQSYGGQGHINTPVDLWRRQIAFLTAMPWHRAVAESNVRKVINQGRAICKHAVRLRRVGAVASVWTVYAFHGSALQAQV